jgi:hypothetical protein
VQAVSRKFLATIDGGIEKLKEKRQEIQKLQREEHHCDCEYCDRNSDEMESLRLDGELKEVNEEIGRLERYKKQHA